MIHWKTQLKKNKNQKTLLSVSIIFWTFWLWFENLGFYLLYFILSYFCYFILAGLHPIKFYHAGHGLLLWAIWQWQSILVWLADSCWCSLFMLLEMIEGQFQDRSFLACMWDKSFQLTKCKCFPSTCLWQNASLTSVWDAWWRTKTSWWAGH